MHEIFSWISIWTCLGVALICLGFLHLRGAWAMFGLNVSMGFWQLGKIGTLHSELWRIDPQLSHWVSLSAAALIPFFFLTMAYQSSGNQRLKLQNYLLVLLPLALMYLQWNHLIVSEFSLEEWGIQHQPGPWYYPFLVYYVVFFGLGLNCLLPKTWWNIPYLRVQQWSTGIAALLGILLGSLDFVNTLWNLETPLPNLAPMIFSIVLGWSMYRYELVEKTLIWKKSLIYLWAFLGSWLALELADQVWIGVFSQSLPLWLVAFFFPFVLWLGSVLLHWANPVSRVNGQEWEIFQSWLGRIRSSEQLIEGLVDLAQDRGYQKVGAVLLSANDAQWFGNVPNQSRAELLKLSSHHHRILHMRALYHSLRFGQSSDESLHSLRQDLVFLQNWGCQIWLPLVHRGQCFGFIWMNDAPFLWRQFVQEIKTLQTSISSASSRLALFDALELNHQKERLAEIGFLTASLAHQVKNPLEGIIGALEVWDEIQEASMIEIARKEAYRLEERVQLFLEWTKSVELKIDKIFVNQFAQGHLPEKWQIEGTVPLVVLADAQALEQIFEVLCANAVRHAPSEQYFFHTEVQGQYCILKFVDQGPGVTHPDKLFKPFQSSHAQGHGLGLALAHKLVRLMQGDLYYQKSPIYGSEFCVKLPIAGE